MLPVRYRRVSIQGETSLGAARLRAFGVCSDVDRRERL